MKLTAIKTIIVAALAALLAEGCAQGQQPLAKHVILISLDGSRPDFYMDSSWNAPNLRRLMQEGVYAAQGIRSDFPSVTYPSHTTLVTGADPARTGIYYNTPFGGKPGHWYWNASSIRCETLWDAVKAAGMTSGAVMWPVTVGAPIAYNFPVRRPEKGEHTDRLSAKYPYINPPDLLQRAEAATGRHFNAASLGSADFAQSKTIATIARYIIRTYKPNLMAIHFVGIDHREHKHGRDGRAVREVVHVTDSLVGTVLRAVNEAGILDSTAIIITGDHGFADTKGFFAPNVYLARHGLITKKGWTAMFHAAGGSAFLYLKHGGEQPTLDSVVAILKASPEYRKGYFRILDRKTLDRMGANPEVALALAMKEGIAATNAATGPVTGKRKGGGHGYDPAYPDLHTMFIAAGAGIAVHKNITGMGIRDVAPLVARLLGLDFKAPDGVLPPGIVASGKP
jgi:predicted AlkP superfamily pyrophosphatase or phosphodiesterase